LYMMDHMKTLFFLTLIFSGIAFGDDYSKLSREERCKIANGEVSSHGTPKTAQGSPFGPIDCTCGGKRFNPLREGDTCKDGKIISALENYCETSKGDLRPMASKPKFALVPLKKCTCGEEEFNPTKTSLCTAGKLTSK